MFVTHDDLNPNLGNALEIKLPSNCTPGVDERLRISYNTNGKSQAINWLSPS
jgi:leukotriene-A4 hydrolase